MKTKQEEEVRKIISSYIESHRNVWHNVSTTVKAESIIKCDGCKCLIDVNDTVPGEKEIRERYVTSMYPFASGNFEDYIHITRYCKRCAPKPKTKAKGGKK